MLEKLLAEIKSGSTLQTTALAKRLNTSPAMVEAMIEELKRRGLLSEVDLGCSQTCSACSLAGSCATSRDRGRLWQVVSKAR